MIKKVDQPESALLPQAELIGLQIGANAETDLEMIWFDIIDRIWFDIIELDLIWLIAYNFMKYDETTWHRR